MYVRLSYIGIVKTLPYVRSVVTAAALVQIRKKNKYVACISNLLGE